MTTITHETDDLTRWQAGFRERRVAERLLDAGLIPEFWELVDETGDAYRVGYDGNAFATEAEADAAAEELPGVKWAARRVTMSDSRPPSDFDLSTWKLCTTCTATVHTTGRLAPTGQ